MANKEGRGGGPAEVERYLKGMSYPASKQDLINHARSNNAPEHVISALNGIADGEYGSPADVNREMGKGGGGGGMQGGGEEGER